VSLKLRRRVSGSGYRKSIEHGVWICVSGFEKGQSARLTILLRMSHPSVRQSKKDGILSDSLEFNLIQARVSGDDVLVSLLANAAGSRLRSEINCKSTRRYIQISSEYVISMSQNVWRYETSKRSCHFSLMYPFQNPAMTFCQPPSRILKYLAQSL